MLAKTKDRTACMVDMQMEEDNGMRARMPLSSSICMSTMHAVRSLVFASMRHAGLKFSPALCTFVIGTVNQGRPGDVFVF